MLGYILRRLLWMIPTILGILVINFAVLRLQAASLTESLNQDAMQGSDKAGADTGKGDQRGGASSNVLQTYIDKFRRSGNDLPPVLNLRGFVGKDDLVAWLRDTDATSPLKPSERSAREKALWLYGRFAVLPLAEILADDGLADLHGPASLAFSLCAHTTITRDMAEHLPSPVLNALNNDNSLLANHRINATNLPGVGHRTTDPQAAAKRKVLLDWIAQPTVRTRYDATTGGRTWAIVAETGFVDIMGKLFSGTLESESRKEYVFTLIGERWYRTFGLSILAIAIAWGISIPLGIRSARRKGTLEDTATTQSLFLLWSLPTMFVGTLLLHHFCTDSSTAKAWFPNAGLWSTGSESWPWWSRLTDWIWHASLPLVCLTYGSFTELSRFMRANLLEQLSSDYVRTARAKGVSEDGVVYRHAFRNSMITMITLGAGLLAGLFGGSIIVEQTFSIPGLGQLLYDAAVQRDAPLVMASTLIQVSLLLVGILMADIAYALVDPRLRSRYA